MSGRPRILAPSIRPFGSTQDRRWISKKARASPASAFSYERYALCSLGVQRLLRYPGPTPEASTGYPASLSSLDSCPQKRGGRNAWNGGRIALEWVAELAWKTHHALCALRFSVTPIAILGAQHSALVTQYCICSAVKFLLFVVVDGREKENVPFLFATRGLSCSALCALLYARFAQVCDNRRKSAVKSLSYSKLNDLRNLSTQHFLLSTICGLRWSAWGCG
jgi:hypothetical protein